MNDGKKRRSSELPAHKRFGKIAQPMDLSIAPEHKTCSARDWGSAPNKHETGGFRVNGIRLLQSGYRFALLAIFSNKSC